MFKKTILPNEYDMHLKELINEFDDKRNDLMAQIPQLITKKNVIELYPDGADKNKAIADFEQTKQSLLTYIGAYDNIYNQLMRFDYSRCQEMRTNKYQFKSATSHSIIEIAYSNFYRNRV